MLNFIDPQREILFSFAILEENQRSGSTQCLFRGWVYLLTQRFNQANLPLTHWSGKQCHGAQRGFNFNQMPTDIHIIWWGCCRIWLKQRHAKPHPPGPHDPAYASCLTHLHVQHQPPHNAPNCGLNSYMLLFTTGGRRRVSFVNQWSVCFHSMFAALNGW